MESSRGTPPTGLFFARDLFLVRGRVRARSLLRAGNVASTAGLALLLTALSAEAQTSGAGSATSPPELRYESYREGVGRMVDGVWQVRLTAHEVDWQPRGEGTPLLRAHAFRSDEGVAHMPGPMIRVQVGTPVEVTVTNSLDKTLVVRGLSDRAAEGDTVAVGIGIPSPTAVFPSEPLTLEAGETRSVRFTPTRTGTFVYWGRTPPSTSPLSDEIFSADGPDAPFVGPLVVDSVGGGPDPNEQVMLITRWADFAADRSTWNVSWRMMINGRAWPATERLEYTVGEPVTWRVINTSLHPHPMHLHGFYYEVHAKGDQSRDTTFAPEARRLAVTEWVAGTGQTMRVRWVPETPGSWLFHCHLVRHMSSLQRIPGEAAPSHDVTMEDHAREGMAGMVMGIHVRPDPDEAAPEPEPVRRRIHLYTSSRDGVVDGAPAISFITAEDGGVPATDSVRVPGSPLILTRDEMTEIVVHNRLDFPFGVHWHGLELESRYDGVADWSGMRGRAIPPIAPGDSFAVRIDPPRAGTFIYHVHSEPGHELTQGMYGPFVVLEPGQRWDPEHDRIVLLGSWGSSIAEQRPVVNGSFEPEPMELEVGETYRFRFIHMSADDEKAFRLLEDGEPVEWTLVAKDGAELPESLIRPTEAVVPQIGVGETYDFVWTPGTPGERILEIATGQYPGLRKEAVEWRVMVR